MRAHAELRTTELSHEPVCFDLSLFDIKVTEVGPGAVAYNPRFSGSQSGRIAHSRSTWATREFKASLGTIVRLCLKLNNEKMGA